MSLLSRRVRALAPPIRQLLNRQSRRFDSHQAGHEAEHGSTESAHHVTGGSGKESMGRGFYVTLALIPLSIAVYTVARSDGDNTISQMVEKYRPNEDIQQSRNLLHITMMEQATRDRQLFKSEPQESLGPDLRFTEQFNSGSPWNVVAGEGRADLGELAQHYAARQKRQEDGRKSRLQNGEVRSLYENTSNTADVERRQ